MNVCVDDVVFDGEFDGVEGGEGSGMIDIILFRGYSSGQTDKQTFVQFEYPNLENLHIFGSFTMFVTTLQHRS